MTCDTTPTQYLNSNTIPNLINQSDNVIQLITRVFTKVSESAEISARMEAASVSNGEFNVGFDFDLGLPPIGEYMIDEIDDITLSQVCEALESENAVFEGLFDLSLSPQTADSMEIEEPSPDPEQSRFGPPVSDVEIKTLIKDQERT